MPKPWTEEEVNKIRELYLSGLSIREVARRLGRSFDSVWAKIKSAGINRNIIANAASAPEIDDYTLAEELSRRGYIVEKMTEDKADREYVIYQKIEKEFKFGVISCTHLGSKYQQLTHLKEFYQRCHDSGVTAIFHCGDLLDGIDVYDGQEYEIFCHGFDAQVEYAVEHYPHHPGLKTFVIAGNHDYSFVKRAGGDPLEKISQQRKDVIYLGAYGAYPRISDLRIYIHHGHGGGAYARSYKLQKSIEQFAPEAKPDYYFLGHYHTTCILPHYRNVLAMMVPSFQSQTPFLRRHALNPEIGGFIFTLGLNDEGRKNHLVLAGIEYVPFYVPKERDY